MWLAILFLYLQLSPTFAVACPPGGVFDPSFNKCYIYYNEPAVFVAAESTCRSIGGNLAEIRNGFENTFVAGLVSMYTDGATPSAYWIGANLLLSPKWTWTTNETALYTNFAANEPADPSNSDCASVATDGTNLWKKALCYSALPFVCTANPSSPPTTPPSSNTPCDPGYTQYEDQCYGLFKDFIRPMNYYDSNSFCLQNEKATLPKIPSLAVQNFLYSFIADEKSNIWLGLVCDGPNGINNCYWWDGSHPTYTNWPSNPSATPIIMSITDGVWWNSYDYYPLTKVVVCQKPARKVTMTYV